MPIEKVELLKMWAKTPQNGDLNRKSITRCYHPLLFHMLDVAAVARLVWDECLSYRQRRMIEDSLGDKSSSCVSFLAGIHDLGKASPGFQKRIPQLIANSTLRFSQNDQNRPHGHISAFELSEEFRSNVIFDLLAKIAGGHHGIFPRSIDLAMGSDVLGNKDWKMIRLELMQEFAKTIDFDLGHLRMESSEIVNPAIIPVISGFISVADWIGSNQTFFPCAAEYSNPVTISASDYWIKALQQAQNALENLGWLPIVKFAKEKSFDGVFQEFVPNHLQTTLIDLVKKQKDPYLLIIEAPMGQGKTEAALFAADVAMCRGFARGMYIAMPTQATGNAMFKRVLNEYLMRRGHQGRLNLQLVHGDALLAQAANVHNGEIQEFNPESIGESGDLEAQTWFTAKKRPLLAPFGVGTIDQSLLSVLQTRHWFVRLYGLSGKVVIFDEVHAYDVYMTSILERLLKWLAEVDCTVLMLSATLPAAKRAALIDAYSGRKDIRYERYPRITLAKPGHYSEKTGVPQPICEPIPMMKPFPINVSFSKTDVVALTDVLNQKMKSGGCAAVICSTVSRSIEVFRYLRKHLVNTETMLFHARTLKMWRRAREEEVLCKFGKGSKQTNGTYDNPHRPHRAVLVATQVVEQSLDLDFDFIVSDIAPIDLLLQRSGRLHRHLRKRPAGLEHPSFIVLCDADKEGPPPGSFGRDLEHIYTRYILLRTWLMLRNRCSINIPSEIESLVEDVYGDEVDVDMADWKTPLQLAKQEMESSIIESRRAADSLLISKPDDPFELIEKFNNQFVDEEDPEIHKNVRAATREGDPSVTAVMIRSDVTLSDNPPSSMIGYLLDRSVKLGHRGLYKELLAHGEQPKEWKKNAFLSHMRLLRLDDNNQGFIGNFVITADEKEGITIERDGQYNV